MPLTGYPWHMENRKNGQKDSLSGKTQGILKYCQNTGNFVCSSCKFTDAKCKGYLLRKCPFVSRSWTGLPSQFCACNSHKLCKLAQGKFAVGQGKTQGIWKYNLSGYPASSSAAPHPTWLHRSASGVKSPLDIGISMSPGERGNFWDWSIVSVGLSAVSCLSCLYIVVSVCLYLLALLVNVTTTLYLWQCVIKELCHTGTS